MPFKMVFLRPQNWSRLKPYLLKHYDRHQGFPFFARILVVPRRENPWFLGGVSLVFFWSKKNQGWRVRVGRENCCDCDLRSSCAQPGIRNIYHHHHPESQKGKSSEANSGSVHPYGRYENAEKTSKTISTIAILSPVQAIFEKRAATVEIDTFISPGDYNKWECNFISRATSDPGRCSLCMHARGANSPMMQSASPSRLSSPNSTSPKGPFRTKNAIAMEIVVFCYRGSLLLSLPIRCHFPRKNSIQITIAVVNH